MDPNWTSAPPKGSLPCLLCKCVISFANKDKNKYFQHLTRDHGTFFNMNLVLIINLLEKSQLLRLISKIKGEGDEEERRRRNNKDVQVQTEPDQDLNITKQTKTNTNEKSIEKSTEDNALIEGMEVGDECAEAKMSVHVTPEIVIPPEIISSDFEPPDNSDIVAATLEETPDDSNMTLDILDDSIGHHDSQNPLEENGSVHLEDVSNSKSGEIKPNQDMVAVYLQNCSEYFKNFPHQLKACSRAQVDKFDTEDPSFPSGWKVKITLRGDTSLTMKQREIREFLSPEFKIFRSKVAVVEYMRAMGGYSDEEMYRVLPMQVKRELW